jgi:hypothetical protein
MQVKEGWRMMKSWRTTLLGLPALLTGLAALAQCIADATKTGHIDFTCLAGAITMAGIGGGLVVAKDSRVTGGTVRQ